ncbi:hypothetical protein LWC34_38910 [Kibdelosporangium philippinense]|uniref:HNH endonuclease n=1 Tax=Kibdelosporangium philippinense TaxID=211113 RepID=A0ABS8ZQ36_9PSEU|nr:hypothetical protein [Kibdelosporangium philippinense]MCE7008741.1 hypothetical protein [Kibdelosporangium philippinense]
MAVKAQQARRSGRPWRRFRRLVLETYGPLCCFGDACKFPSVVINLDLPPNDPASFTVHHLDPLSLGGSLLDLERARPAHFRCNSAQGNRPFALSSWTSHDWPVRLP